MLASNALNCCGQSTIQILFLIAVAGAHYSAQERPSMVCDTDVPQQTGPSNGQDLPIILLGEG
jgi:hypothetical protein